MRPSSSEATERAYTQRFTVRFHLCRDVTLRFTPLSIEQKIFHAEIVVDVAKVSAEAKVYQPIPFIAEFLNEDGSDSLSETIEANYKRVKQEILSLVESEIERIKNNANLKHLIKE
nr:MAG TPA: hypothetical protein [Caudoviricetes sp.]